MGRSFVYFYVHLLLLSGLMRLPQDGMPSEGLRSLSLRSGSQRGSGTLDDCFHVRSIPRNSVIDSSVTNTSGDSVRPSFSDSVTLCVAIFY